METNHHHQPPHEGGHAAHGKSMYGKLFLMLLLSFIAMYVLMYAMADRLQNMLPNINQFYMAGLMATPMLVIEILIMGSMYGNKKLNLILVVSGLVLSAVFLFCIRTQAAVGDKQFLRSMIPHHAAAILMVEQTSLTDPEIKKLASDIITAQQKEIEFMKAKLEELEK